MCGNASIWAKVAFFVALVGMILHIVGWATNFWMVYELPISAGIFEVYVGLWWQKVCNIDLCDEGAPDARFQTDIFNAVRGLETVTMCLAIFGTVMLLVYVLVDAARTRLVAIVLVILFFIAGTSSAVGMILLLIEIDAPYMVGWSVGLTTIASPLLLIAATLLIPDLFDEGKPLDRAPENTRPYTPRGRDTPLSPRGIVTGWTA
ncbi:uncharacterized protein [Littorina saxatilis]|uniref:Uncharacterized protein n=1 Tax=Littorina saxatilis TaxID=31220 RepID=A0AAN9C0U4_9CAEN